MSEAEIFTEEQIREFFEENFEVLRMEGGHSLAPEVKEIALQQVLLYWRKLRSVAQKVTDTEVRLTLPGQTTAKGRPFGIEGVVDIVRDNDRVVMYDVKTHDAESVRASPEPYELQINVYAHIWQNLHQQPLDQTAVIATAYPAPVKKALGPPRDEPALEAALDQWEPLVQLDFDPDSIAETIADFGKVVDCIEEGKFSPANVAKLKQRVARGSRSFAEDICGNCDARFSCESYREFALAGRSNADRLIRQYFSDLGSELEREAWAIAALDVVAELPSVADLE
jgi:hypothetical protein